MQPDWLAAGIWQAREMRLQKSTGNYFSFMLMKYHTFLSWDEGWWVWGHRRCWASILRKWSRIPCLWLGMINVITACLEALSFLGKDPGLADSSSQCGDWWKREPAKPSAGRFSALEHWILNERPGFQSQLGHCGFSLWPSPRPLPALFFHPTNQMRLF